MSSRRWKQAQKFEFESWANSPNIALKEWQEIKKKYNKYFRILSKKLEVSDRTKILDIGCGPTCIIGLFDKGKKFGIEPLAKELKLPENIEEVQIFSGKGENLPFKESFFDLVVCRNVIDHTDRPSKVIKEVRRVLKNNGHFLLASYVYAPFIVLVKQLSEMVPQLRNVGHPHTFSLKSLEKLVTNDFIIVERKIIHAGFHPNDYAKVDEKTGSLSLLQRMILFINFKILRQSWFLKEYCLLLKPRVR